MHKKKKWLQLKLNSYSCKLCPQSDTALAYPIIIISLIRDYSRNHIRPSMWELGEGGFGIDGRNLYLVTVCQILISSPDRKAHRQACSIILVIFSWTQIERSGFSGREIGVSNREIFSQQKIFHFSVKNCYLQCRTLLNFLFASVWLTGGKWNVSVSF